MFASIIKFKIVFEITQWINQVQNSVNAYNTRATFLSALTNQYNTQLTGIDIGEMVTHNGITFPSWIGFIQLNISSSNFYSENQVKIWYSDSSFRTEYDENELVVIPPLANLETFFSTKTSVDLALAEYKDNLLAAISTARNGIPETDIIKETYLWKQSNNTNNTTNTNWSILIYGRLDGNGDYVKDAIRAYIAANTTRTEEAWKAVLPDIYLSTQFYIFPKWMNMSISETQLEVGQYSPIVNLRKEINYVKSFFTLANATHIETYLTVMPFQIKSISASFVSGPDNRDSIFSIRDVFPDYLNVPTTEVLWDMQSTKTKEWILQMGLALLSAEIVNTFDAVPTGMRKVTRNNILYVVFKYDNIEYLVASKRTIPGYTV